MLTLPAAIQSIIGSLQGRPVEIHDIYLGSQTAEDSNTLHFVSFYKALTFFSYIGGTSQSYTPLAITRSAIKKTAQGEIDRISYKVDNVNKAMGAYAATFDFRNKRIVTRLVYREALESASNCKVIFDGIIQSIQFEQKSMVGTAVPIISSLTFTTGWAYQINCNNKFGDSLCTINKNSSDNKVSGTATGGTTSTVIDTVNLTQANDYWKIGIVTFTSGSNNNLSRKVISSNQSTKTLTLDYALPYAVAAGDTFNVFRGCDKRLATCTDVYNNDVNYKGFHTIPLTK